MPVKLKSIRDSSLRKVARRALLGDGRFSYDELKKMIASTFDGRKITKTPVAAVVWRLGSGQVVLSCRAELLRRYLVHLLQIRHI